MKNNPAKTWLKEWRLVFWFSITSNLWVILDCFSDSITWLESSNDFLIAAWYKWCNAKALLINLKTDPSREVQSFHFSKFEYYWWYFFWVLFVKNSKLEMLLLDAVKNISLNRYIIKIKTFQYLSINHRVIKSG